MTVTTRRFEFEYKSISAWLMRGGNLIFCEYLNLLHKFLNVIIYHLVLSTRDLRIQLDYFYLEMSAKRNRTKKVFLQGSSDFP